ncbi:hypothetical protein HaLaN_19123 [Haematococcus lacustris]|uniref:Uncharacterized protein n=1 Tax=Haematococcus lacustris TaxID=44745 RepID=A0A699ZQ24_HAELA|nr:hypothetical protein HaLaN_19123 [Haematococcus lacustris]
MAQGAQGRAIQWDNEAHCLRHYCNTTTTQRGCGGWLAAGRPGPPASVSGGPWPSPPQQQEIDSQEQLRPQAVQAAEQLVLQGQEGRDPQLVTEPRTPAVLAKRAQRGAGSAPAATPTPQPTASPAKPPSNLAAVQAPQQQPAAQSTQQQPPPGPESLSQGAGRAKRGAGTIPAPLQQPGASAPGQPAQGHAAFLKRGAGQKRKEAELHGHTDIPTDPVPLVKQQLQPKTTARPGSAALPKGKQAWGAATVPHPQPAVQSRIAKRGDAPSAPSKAAVAGTKGEVGASAAGEAAEPVAQARLGARPAAGGSQPAPALKRVKRPDAVPVRSLPPSHHLPPESVVGKAAKAAAVRPAPQVVKPPAATGRAKPTAVSSAK